MKKINVFLRQIHLDFHTSEHIPGIGEEFDTQQFISALRLGRVNSINFFAMGHHGWCYYPTETDWRHPHLKTDLVGGMMEACREGGINAVIYITVGWNDRASREHPEWCIRCPDGGFDGPETMHPHTSRPGGWNRLCLNSPYLDSVVLPVTREVLDMYDPDGIWFDITGEFECICDWCREGMSEAGLDWNSSEDRKAYAREVYRRYLQKTTETVWGRKSDAWIYHNGTDKKGRYDLYPYWSHYEIESLPTGGWGYNHFPANARYFTMLPETTVVGMTGKFHQSWGEFGGYKNSDALKYECAQIVSLGCAACVGDQLHPSGKMDEDTYRIIGEAYRYIEEREEWLIDTRPVAEVAVLSPSAVNRITVREDRSESGACRMLMELQIPHVVIDDTMAFTPYRVLVLPDSVIVDEDLGRKLDTFTKSGGALVLSAESGLNESRTRFGVDICAEYAGPSPWDAEYIAVHDELASGLVRSPFLMYESGTQVNPGAADILADTWKPYFSRTYGRFCSHRNTPPEKPSGHPAVIRKGNVLYLAHPIFRIYAEKGMQLHRDLFRNCLKLVYPERFITAQMPSCGRVSVMEQVKESRLIIHLLYANPITRGATEVIEDIVPLYDINVSLHLDKEPRNVYRAPSNQNLNYSYSENTLTFNLPKLRLSELIVVERQLGPTPP